MFAESSYASVDRYRRVCERAQASSRLRLAGVPRKTIAPVSRHREIARWEKPSRGRTQS